MDHLYTGSDGHPETKPAEAAAVVTGRLELAHAARRGEPSRSHEAAAIRCPCAIRAATSVASMNLPRHPVW